MSKRTHYVIRLEVAPPCETDVEQRIQSVIVFARKKGLRCVESKRVEPRPQRRRTEP